MLRHLRGAKVLAEGYQLNNVFNENTAISTLIYTYFFDKKGTLTTMPQFLGSSAVEQLAVNQLVVGSIPTRGANITLKDSQYCESFLMYSFKG